METPASPPPTDHKPSNISDALKSNMPNKNLSDILQKETAGKNKTQVERNKQEHETRDESVLLKNKATYGQENQVSTKKSLKIIYKSEVVNVCECYFCGMFFIHIVDFGRILVLANFKTHRSALFV